MKIQYLLLITGLFFSCVKTTKAPDGIYSKEEMTQIMRDMYVLEFQLRELNLDDDSTRRVFKVFEERYYQEKNIDTTRYIESFNYYLNTPQGLADIYRSITDSLSLEQRLYNESISDKAKDKAKDKE